MGNCEDVWHWLKGLCRFVPLHVGIVWFELRLLKVFLWERQRQTETDREKVREKE